jgi:hypothetical protein
MKMIPQHIIDLFSVNQNAYPCISYIKIKDKSILTKLLSKSTTIWYMADENQGKQIMVEEYLVYDSTGIDVYHKLDENGGHELFILSKIDKRDIVDFTLYTIKKQNENYGNNGE